MSLVPAVTTIQPPIKLFFRRSFKNIYAPIKRTLSNEAFLLQARRSGRDFTRERALPLQRLVPLLLNFRKGTNRDELDQFFETITDDPASVTPVSEAAFCRARQKLKPEALVTLNNVLLDSTNQQVVQQRWRGLRVLAVDGSTGRLPNLPAIEEYFGKPSGSGVPLARFSRLFDVLNNSTLSHYVLRARSLASQAVVACHWHAFPGYSMY